MNNTLIDNSTEQLSMLQTLKECFATDNIQSVRIATGYWDVPGLALLANDIRSYLERESTRLFLLIGKDPKVYASQVENPKYKDSTYPDDWIRTDINDLEPKDEYKNAISLLLDYCTDKADSKIQIRIFKRNAEDETQFLHSKCYIFDGKNAGKAYGLIGSSNFTQKGLQGNAELNYLETEPHKVLSEDTIPNHKTHIQWFKEKWELADEWNKEFLEQVLKPAPITKAVEKEREQKENEPEQTPEPQVEALTPYEVYIKYLQTQFGDITDTSADGVLKSYLPKEYTPLTYQIDAVKQCFATMKRYNGFILGDVVGLGKTVVGLLIVRRFIDEAQSMGRSPLVLIVTPPAIKPGWENTIKDFDKNNTTKIADYVKFITTGSIGKINEELDDVEEFDGDEFESEIENRQYGLVLIDESHNFRNKRTLKYEALDELIGRQVPQPYVGLLSATPQNNSPEDLENQIFLFQREKNNSNLPNIEGGKLNSFFERMKEEFKKARNESDVEKAKATINEMSKEIRERVLNELVVRRTRSDIKQMYAEDSENLKFPKIAGPHHLEYEMDTQLVELFYDTMTAICPPDEGKHDPKKNIGFYRYQAIMFFADKDVAKKYEKNNLTVEGISARLQKIMQILLVKRLESSFGAFRQSLQNLFQNTCNMIEMLENDCVFVCPDVDVNAEFLDKETKKKLPFDVAKENLERKIVGKPENNQTYKAGDFREEYLTLLKQDKELIESLLERWKQNDYDPKMDAFKESIKEKLFDKTINPPQKLVIFTEAKDTQDALVRILNVKKHTALSVSSDTLPKLKDTIRWNFDANCPIDEQRNDYDVIVTTEVLAEGVNLHRANVILNYDEPWNATRLIQRIGRVNRIGSKEDTVHVFNFLPSNEGNKEIKLMEKAFAKLQAFHSMFGEDSKIFTEDEELIKVDLTHTIDGEASPFGEYIMELKQYRDEHPERYDALAQMTAENFGGKIAGRDGEGNLIVFTDNSAGYISIGETTNSDNWVQLISPLNTMARLKCRPNDKYVAGVNLSKDSNFYIEAKREYDGHVVNGIKAGDLGKKAKEAIEVVREIRQHPDITNATKKTLKKVEEAIRHNDKFSIKTLNQYKTQYDTYGETLWGIDNDINMWIETTFARTTELAVQKRGETSTAFYKLD